MGVQSDLQRDHDRRHGRAAAALLALGPLLLAACTTVGPDFTPPAPTWDAAWSSPSLAKMGGAAGDVAAAESWWQVFGDPALDKLLAEAVAENHNLRLAALRVTEARAQLAGARANLLPQSIHASAAGGYGASAPGDVSLSQADGLFGQATVSTAWEIDFWGRFRRAIQSADANYLAQRDNYETFIILLRAETARAYFAIRTLQERLAVAKENAGRQKRSLEITEVLFRNGANGELDVQQARTQYLATLAAIPQLETSLALGRNALCALLGRPPSDLPELALSAEKLPTIPPGVEAAMPADLLRRRPDVRAAEMAAAAQSALIGVAKSDLYPHLALLGTIGVTRTTLGGLSNQVQMAIGPTLSWDFLDLGRVRSNVRVQSARFEQTLESYRETVIQAAREVDDAALAFQGARDQDAVLVQSQAAAARALELAQTRYKEGFSDFQRVLDAQAALLREQDRFLSNRGEMAGDLVAIYKAIGGGWSAARDSGPIQPESDIHGR